jgi:hypothetical protein
MMLGPDAVARWLHFEYYWMALPILFLEGWDVAIVCD